MPIIRVIDHENNRQKRNKDRKEQGRQKVCEKVRAKWFFCVFKLDVFNYYVKLL